MKIGKINFKGKQGQVIVLAFFFLYGFNVWSWDWVPEDQRSSSNKKETPSPLIKKSKTIQPEKLEQLRKQFAVNLETEKKSLIHRYEIQKKDLEEKRVRDFEEFKKDSELRRERYFLKEKNESKRELFNRKIELERKSLEQRILNQLEYIQAKERESLQKLKKEQEQKKMKFEEALSQGELPHHKIWEFK
ncbi:MAG: hypothetical protein CL678_02480 [Bdellovibrionaceae bacterium]|nr:hypothetical protein [Pseudobdellovibrionaceae bacterium]